MDAKRGAKLNKAIDRLAAMKEGWSLMAATMSDAFINDVADELATLREEVARLKEECRKLRETPCPWCMREDSKIGDKTV